MKAISHTLPQLIEQGFYIANYIARIWLVSTVLREPSELCCMCASKKQGHLDNAGQGLITITLLLLFEFYFSFFGCGQLVTTCLYH